MKKCFKDCRFWCTLGGVAAAIVGEKILKSKKTREICVSGMAKGMKLHQDACVALQNMKEDAQDLCDEAKQKAQEDQD